MGEEVEYGVEELDQPTPEGRAVIHVIPFADVIAGGRIGIRRFGGVPGIRGIGRRFRLRFQLVVPCDGLSERVGVGNQRFLRGDPLRLGFVGHLLRPPRGGRAEALVGLMGVVSVDLQGVLRHVPDPSCHRQNDTEKKRYDFCKEMHCNAPFCRRGFG